MEVAPVKRSVKPRPNPSESSPKRLVSVVVVKVTKGTVAIYQDGAKILIPPGATEVEIETPALVPLPAGESYEYTLSLTELGEGETVKFGAGERVTVSLRS